MTYIERRGRVWGLVAEQAAARGGPVSAADVCAAVVPGVQVTGAWLSAGLDAQAGHLMQVTDEVGRQLADLQLTLGEGPLLDASASSGPVLASELADGNRGPLAGVRAGREQGRGGRGLRVPAGGRGDPGRVCLASTGTGPAR